MSSFSKHEIWGLGIQLLLQIDPLSIDVYSYATYPVPHQAVHKEDALSIYKNHPPPNATLCNMKINKKILHHHMKD